MGRIYTRRRFLINNNISASECFDRYFSLMLEKDAIPTANIKQLIFEMNELDLANGIKQIYEDGKIIRLRFRPFDSGSIFAQDKGTVL